MKNEHILQDRAKLLARPSIQEEIKGDFIEVLVFKLAQETYGHRNKIR